MRGRCYALACLSCGPAPVRWGATVYRRGAPWVGMEIDLTAKGIFDRARDYR